MYFIDLDEESLQITEEVLKSYNVTYKVCPRVEKVSRTKRILVYDVKVDIDVEFYDYLQAEIHEKIINTKFEEARRQTRLSELEKCFEAPFAGKNISQEKQRKEDVVGYKDYQKQIENNTIRQMEEAARKRAQERREVNSIAEFMDPNNILSGLFSNEFNIPEELMDNVSGFKITISNSFDKEQPDVTIMSWNPFEDEEDE